MEHIKKLIFVVVALLMTACSSIHYTMGTDCLRHKDFRQAIYHLEEACKQEPYASKSHNNLGCAYLLADNLEKAWEHVHLAVYLDPKNEAAVFTCKGIREEMEEKYQIVNGVTQQYVIDSLGQPDYTYSRENKTVIVYGTNYYIFADDVLVERKIK